LLGSEKLKGSVSRILRRWRPIPLPNQREEEILSFAPYRIRIYEDLLRQLSAEEKYVVCHLENIIEKKRKGKINVLLRHDIDTAECIRNMGHLLEKDLEHQFIPGVYLRADGEAYDLRHWRHTIEDYHRLGIPFGLHSVCYIHDRYTEIFRQETQKFVDETGIVPRSFTLHGLGEKSLKNRLQFISTVRQIAKENGYAITDCSSRYISYDYVLHDCHWDESRQKRYILTEFTEVPAFIKGREYLILTHPCYWEK
jgi:hypothetical protein